MVKPVPNIAKSLNRHKSTIYREIDGKPRIGRGRYQADIAHRKALKRIANRGNKYILDVNEKLYDYVVEKLKLGWSPEQISIRLPIDFPNNEFMTISHESIYTYIYSCIGSNNKVKKGFRKAQKAERKANLPFY